MAQMRIFVSHSHQDNAFCHVLVKALRGAGVDVWYDEHNMGSGRLGPTIEREERERPVFVVILSPAALHSPWVEDETRWAYGLWRNDGPSPHPARHRRPPPRGRHLAVLAGLQAHRGPWPAALPAGGGRAPHAAYVGTYPCWGEARATGTAAHGERGGACRACRACRACTPRSPC